LRLRERHGSRLQFQVKVGAILETPPPPGFPREEIVRMFGAARRQSGMPLDPEIVLKKETPTTNRAGIAAKAVGLVAPDKFDRYMRALRYAALVDGRDIESLDVQEAIAGAIGVDEEQFGEAMESDEAQREFYGDQAEARVKGITGFPTVTFRAPNGKEVGVSGFQPTEAYEAALARITGARWVEDPPPDLRALLRKSGRLATAEVAEVFDILEDAATLDLLALEAKGAARKIEAAGGLFWDAT
jgi:predicted DsbA family dithiol-disulfide isomerase